MLPFFDLYSRWEVMRWLGRPPRRAIADLAEARERLGRWQERQAGLAVPQGRWALIPRTGPAGQPLPRTGPAGQPPDGPVGTILLLPLDDATGRTGEVEIGWHLHPDYQGRGLATEAAQALLGAAARAGYERVLALTDPDNAASQAVAGARPRRRGPDRPLVRPDHAAVCLDGTVEAISQPSRSQRIPWRSIRAVCASVSGCLPVVLAIIVVSSQPVSPRSRVATVAGSKTPATRSAAAAVIQG